MPKQPMIDFDGSPIEKSFLTKIYGSPVLLPAKYFKYLTRLAYELVYPAEGSKGWVSKQSFERGSHQESYLYKMRAHINVRIDCEWAVYQSDHSGNYRLLADPSDIAFNWENLAQFPDHDISILRPRETAPEPVKKETANPPVERKKGIPRQEPGFDMPREVIRTSYSYSDIMHMPAERAARLINKAIRGERHIIG